MPLGPLMMDIAGLELSAEERELLGHPLIGGVILFTRNYHDRAQLAALVDALHATRDPPLLVAVDQEGGRVQRFREGFTVLPPARHIGRLYNEDQREGLRFADISGWLMAAELRAVGVDFSFAPVLDLDYGVSGVIGNRAFHADPEAVAELARAWLLSMRRAGMAAVVKHFPGHGAVAEDSHHALPRDGRTLADLRAADMLPFERLINLNVAAVMVAHVVYTAMDKLPASLSARWIGGELRTELGFKGAVFCDDINMGATAAAGDFPSRARRALAAGCDMLPVCNNRAGLVNILDSLGDYESPSAQARFARLHGRDGLDDKALRHSMEWRHNVGLLRQYMRGGSLELGL
jgi:beta-N-acetylhexosaminidase